MLEYIFILIAAIVIFPLFFFLITRGKVERSVLLVLFSGWVIAAVGIFVGRNYPFHYTALIMLGLAFSISILIDKRFAKEELREMHGKKSSVDKSVMNTEIDRLVETQVSATSELENIVIDNIKEDGFKLWMSANKEQMTMPKEEGTSRGT